MAAKYFCDCCRQEITDDNRPKSVINNNTRLSGIYKRQGAEPLSVEVITGRGNIQNAGDWCKYCIIDAVNSLDDRPKVGDH